MSEIQTVIFENKIKILIYGPNLQIENADCNFQSTFTDEKEPNTCTLFIYNLNDKNMDAIINNTNYVEIFTNQYGLTDTNGNVLWQKAFGGVLRDAVKIPKPSYTKKGKLRKTRAKIKYLTPSITPQTDDGESYIQMELQEGDGTDIGTFFSKSYRKGFNIKKILTDLAKSINLEIVFDKNIKNYYVNFPIILHDNVRNSLNKIASYIGAKAIISNNKVFITSKSPNKNFIYYQFDESNIPQPKYLQNKKIEFMAPYMPDLHIGTFVRLVNKKMEIDGVYQICKLENEFSNHDEDCETKVTVMY